MTSLEEFAKAIEDGDSAKVQQLISTGVVDVNAPLPRWRAPPALVHAAERNRKEVVDILLRANAHIDRADSYGKRLVMRLPWLATLTCSPCFSLLGPISTFLIMVEGTPLRVRYRTNTSDAH
jgi:hypothetical protein